MAQPAAAEPLAVPWPCERMCHSLTALPDGRLLVIGGRNKEGICRDMWLLDTVSCFRARVGHGRGATGGEMQGGGRGPEGGWQKAEQAGSGHHAISVYTQQQHLTPFG